MNCHIWLLVCESYHALQAMGSRWVVVIGKWHVCFYVSELPFFCTRCVRSSVFVRELPCWAGIGLCELPCLVGGFYCGQSFFIVLHATLGKEATVWVINRASAFTPFALLLCTTGQDLLLLLRHSVCMVHPGSRPVGH